MKKKKLAKLVDQLLEAQNAMLVRIACLEAGKVDKVTMPRMAVQPATDTRLYPPAGLYPRVGQ